MLGLRSALTCALLLTVACDKAPAPDAAKPDAAAKADAAAKPDAAKADAAKPDAAAKDAAKPDMPEMDHAKIAKKEPGEKVDPADLVKPGEAKIGDKTWCLASGEVFTVDADAPKAELDGKTYYFCCPGCDEKFLAEPDKYKDTKPEIG